MLQTTCTCLIGIFSKDHKSCGAYNMYDTPEVPVSRANTGNVLMPCSIGW